MIPDWFDPVALVPGIPLIGAILVAILRDARAGAWVVILTTAAGFAVALRLPAQIGASLFLLVDPLSAHLAILTAFIGLTTAIISRRFIAQELASDALDIGRVQSYHTLFLTFLGFMLLALLSNNLGVAWVALEAATISAVLVVGLPRTDAAIEASWKFFILCGVGIALALFGTVVMYLAALPALGPGYGAMTWTELTFAAITPRSRMIRSNATLSTEPASTADTGVGPSACASGIQECSGTSPALVP